MKKSNLQTWPAAAIVAVALAVPTSANADAGFNAALAAANCANCHGQGGASTSKIPKLTEVTAKGMAESLKAFRDGTKSGTIMNRISKGYNDAQIDAIAKHIAKKR